MGRRRTPRMPGLNVTPPTLAKIKRIGLRHRKSPPTGSESHSHPRWNPQRFNPTVRCSSYVGALNGRVQALARAHDQITKQNWGPAPLMSLFVDEMAAQSGDDPDRLVLDGPAVLLMPRAVSTMALVIHELIT